MSSRFNDKFDPFMVDWDDLWKRLKRYTYRRFLQYDSKMELEGVIIDAIIDVVEGRRPMPENTKLFPFLCGIIRSKYSHIPTGDKNTQSIEDDSTPPLLAEDLNDHINCDEFCNKLREAVSDDAELSAIVEIWILDPAMKPQEVASMRNISIKKMRSAQKRLDRRISTLRKEWRRHD